MPHAQGARKEKGSRRSRAAMADKAYTTQAMSTYDITRMSQFSQAATKVPPSFDGKTSWFAFEDAIDDWRDITELDDEKRGPAGQA